MGELEGKRFCIAPHLAPHFKLGRALQSWEKVTCVAPSPFGEEHWQTKSSKRLFSSSLDFDFQHTSSRYDLVLLGKCLGFAPRSKSFAIEPSVQVCSISSLSEFRFAEMSCFATPASASSIRTQIRYAQLT